MTVPLSTRTLRAFAGIGSREAPDEALTLLRRATQYLVELGWTCRSGGAEGSDTACERGALAALEDDLRGGPEHATHGSLEIFLPWPSFGRGVAWYRTAQIADPADGALNLTVYPHPTPAAIALAAQHHPAWAALKQSVQKLHGRNSHQVLGYDLASPVSQVICWTRDGADGSPEHPVGRDTGGTGQAIRLAVSRGISVLNIQRPEHRDRVLARVPGDRL